MSKPRSTLLKMSKVKAVPKKGNSSERGDFRPIPLLSIPSKVYEGIIGDAIDGHFINGGLSNKSQWVNFSKLEGQLNS